MRAWRTHEYGEPLDVLQLDEVAVPEPGAGEVLVRALGIPFNLNDLERITGGNMMVRPELPYSPGMETMGIVDACGPGRRGAARASGSSPSRSRRTAGSPSTRSVPRSPRSRCPTTIPLPDAAALFFPFHLAWLGLFDRAELQAGETVLIHAGRRRLGLRGDPARGRPGRARHRHRRVGREDPALSRPRRADRRELPNRRRSPPSCLEQTGRQGCRRRVRQRRRRGDGGLLQVPRLQRPLPDDGLRVGQDRGRREVDRAPSHRRSGTSSCAV